MGKISILPTEVVSKIAAGEVIQRPSDVLKELVENSIDAGATRIKVQIDDYGYQKIKVVDNGHGMEKGDLENCLLPHSTSKIKHIDDLSNIFSLGFRGEALNSISSISRTTVGSRTKDSDKGYILGVEGGKYKDVKPFGMPIGTSVSVEDIFYNVPVRKKFLRKKTTEYFYIFQILSNLALANPSVGFEFSHNGKEILNIPKNQNWEDRILEIVGDTFYKQLVNLEKKNDHIKILGFLAPPQFSSKTPNRQFIFVNNRPVNNSDIAYEIKKIYGNLLQAKYHPAFILKFGMPTDLVDVNIHPRKNVVKFANNSYVFDLLAEAVHNSLSQNNLTYIKEGYKSSREFLFSENLDEQYLASENAQVPEILQINDLYLIYEENGGMNIVDQHAAHERIVYEKLLQKYEQNSNEHLIEPESSNIFDLPVNEAQLLRENFEVFKELGIWIETFGENLFKVTKIPQLLSDRNFVEIICDVLEDISSDRNIEIDKGSDARIRLALSYMACRGALKGGESLNMEQRKEIVSKINETNSNYTCPHGRPVKVFVPFSELSNWFKRI